MFSRDDGAVQRFTVFVAVFIGFRCVGVTPALPVSVTNAIQRIIVVGGLLAAAASHQL
jgi:hypothetical protein